MLITFGHGTLDKEQLADLTRKPRLDEVVDIRRFPHSRHNPDVESDAMAQWLPRSGVAYSSEVRLGGRRRLPAGTVSEDPWWRVAQFSAYAAYTRTVEFDDALRDIVGRTDRVAVMCSESVWWRCHRRLVADVAVLRWQTTRRTPHARRTAHASHPSTGRSHRAGWSNLLGRGHRRLTASPTVPRCGSCSPLTNGAERRSRLVGSRTALKDRLLRSSAVHEVRLTDVAINFR